MTYVDKMIRYHLLFVGLLTVSANAQNPRTAILVDSLHTVLTGLESRASSIERDEQAASIINQIGWMLIDARQFDRGMVFSRKALRLAERHHFYAVIAQAQLSIGYAVQKKETFFEAANYFEAAKKSAFRAHNDSLLAISYHWAGMCYSDQELPQKSIENFRNELVINQRSTLKNRLAPCFNSLGLNYIKINQLDSALYFFNQCSVESIRTNDHFHAAAAYKNTGRIMIGKGQELEGVAMLQKSIAFFLACDEKFLRDEVHFSYTVLAKFYSQKKQYQQSNYYGQLTWNLVSRLDYTDQKTEISQVLYNNYKAIGDKDKAIFYLEKYIETSLKINQDLVNQQHIAAEARFNDEQQKNQIIVLNQERLTKTVERNWLIGSLIVAILLLSAIGLLYQTVRKQKNVIEDTNLNLEKRVVARTTELQLALEEIKGAQLNGQRIERRRVAADLHDNLGGMMSAIRLTIEAMDSSKLSTKEKQVYQNVLSMTREAYNEIRLLSHNLQPAELEQFGLREALHRLTNKLNNSQLIHFSLITNSLYTLSKELEFNLYLICLELANNIVKHSGATEAAFEFITKGEQLQLFVTDNGKGFIANNTSDGMGMRSVQGRTEQMGGSLAIHSRPGEGTLFQFSIPLIPLAHASERT